MPYGIYFWKKLKEISSLGLKGQTADCIQKISYISKIIKKPFAIPTFCVQLSPKISSFSTAGVTQIF